MADNLIIFNYASSDESVSPTVSSPLVLGSGEAVTAVVVAVVFETFNRSSTEIILFLLIK